MSNEKKGGFFRRMFKRVDASGQDVSPEPKPEVETPEIAPEAEAPRKGLFGLLKDKLTGASAPAETELEQLSVDAPAEEPERVHAIKVEVDSDVAVDEKPTIETVPSEPEPESRGGWFSRLKTGLSKSTTRLSTSITDIFTKRKLDAETLQDLEDTLIQADLGVDMSMRISDAVAKGRYDKEIEPEEVKRILAEEVLKVIESVAVPFEFKEDHKPFVVLVVGVNGSGKTTTIGKLTAIATSEGYSVALAACDTFRAAAVEQLKIWGERTGCDVITAPTGSDASGLAFDAMKQAKENGNDILIVDTAGRLQNKTDLMAELKKVARVIKKQDETAPHSVLLVLDATVGQNAISQTEMFKKTAGVTGLIMTKLDGTARGGILVAIAEKFGLPVHAIGVGEQIEDLQPFNAEEFAAAIAGLDSEDQ